MKKIFTTMIVAGVFFCGVQAFGQNGEAIIKTEINAATGELQVSGVPPAADPASIPASTSIFFPETSYDFGKVAAGPLIRHTYWFKNTGSNPAVLSGVQASCGCTTPEWSQTPVLPGDSGSITAVFDSNNRVGIQQKSITVTYNGEPATIILELKGEVTAPQPPTQLENAK